MKIVSIGQVTRTTRVDKLIRLFDDPRAAPHIRIAAALELDRRYKFKTIPVQSPHDLLLHIMRREDVPRLLRAECARTLVTHWPEKYPVPTKGDDADEVR